MLGSSHSQRWVEAMMVLAELFNMSLGRTLDQIFRLWYV